ncbi:MAG: hypothetical protein ACRDHZ_06185, partial [Ktedonobacteraceae bacterium]
MQILLLIKQPGQQMYTRLLVKTNVAVGTCVSLFAKRFGYPLVDSTGTPLTYCFLTTKTRQILPRHQSLENLNIHSGTCLLFDCVESQDETVLVEQVGNQFVPKPNLLTRRSALGTIASLALTGLGLGWFTGAATRVKAQVGAGTSAVPLPRAQHPS